ncbi:MAG: tRNA lysidine(34) synthetase TilS [Bacillota bacterium]
MLIKKVERYIRSHRLLDEGDKVLVAVSGGPDSLCLLHVLTALAAGLKLELIVGHLNHRFRPEARLEAEAVETLAAAMSIPFEGASANVADYAVRHHLTAQEAARHIRYRFLVAAAQKHGAVKIAVGHHKDDQVETVLFNILRGTGPDGLSGMRPRRAIGPVELIRPLLSVTRLEIEDYCRRNRLNPAIDASNLKTAYTRNKIRLELIPYLEKSYNPGIKEVLERLASMAANDRDYLEAAAEKVRASLCRETGKSMFLLCSRLNRIPEALRGRVVRLSLERFIGRKQINWRRIRQLLALAEADGPAREIQLPGGARAYRSYRYLIITREARSPMPLLEALPLPVPGTAFLPERGELSAKIQAEEDLVWPPAPEQAYLDYDTVPQPLTVRNRRPGDRFFPQGAPGSKKLKDFLIDQKIPSHRRDYYPLITAEDTVVWVAGLRIAHPYRITGQTRRVLVLEWKPKQGRS